MKTKILRKVLTVGSSKLVTLPPNFSASYVWILCENGRIVIEPAEVR